MGSSPKQKTLIIGSVVMYRDKALQDIRETLDLPKDTTDKSELITFQNNALRPILKFQNDTLVSIFKTYIVDRKMKWDTSQDNTKQEFIYSSLSNDKHLKAVFIGTCIGLFTENELKVYLTNQREINRRIIAMGKERLVDQLVKCNRQ